MLHQLQKLCSFLNFLCKAVVLGRAFLVRLYSGISPLLLPHHHLNITSEMRLDLEVWHTFLSSPEVYTRPFMDFTDWTAENLNFYTDASGSWEKGGIGAICNDSWLYQAWNKELKLIKPSIEYLELYAVMVGVFLWIHRFSNRRVNLYCDNKSVQDMINDSS